MKQEKAMMMMVPMLMNSQMGGCNPAGMNYAMPQPFMQGMQGRGGVAFGSSMGMGAPEQQQQQQQQQQRSQQPLQQQKPPTQPSGQEQRDSQTATEEIQSSSTADPARNEDQSSST